MEANWSTIDHRTGSGQVCHGPLHHPADSLRSCPIQDSGSSMISSGQGEKKIPLDGGTAFPPLVLPLRSPGLSLLSRFRPTFFRLGAKKTRSVIHGLHIRRGVFAAGRRLSSDQTPDLESDFMAHYGALSDRWRRPRTRGPGDKTTCPYLERNVMCSCPPSIQRTLWRL
jgi:hypothetical protein